jgi:MFS family permease
MRSILQKRSLRFVFAANVISMLGSGMNSAAVAWTILQRTHSEMALGMFAALQTIPAMLMLPFTGVIIDREDRRRLVMWLDASRAIVIFAVMVLAFLHRVQAWQLYLMNTLVSFLSRATLRCARGGMWCRESLNFVTNLKRRKPLWDASCGKCAKDWSFCASIAVLFSWGRVGHYFSAR